MGFKMDIILVLNIRQLITFYALLLYIIILYIIYKNKYRILNNIYYSFILYNELYITIIFMAKVLSNAINKMLLKVSIQLNICKILKKYNIY